ncbi:hypothetical protein Y695_04023 [Hydrogenophaga sp. T4]|nr:hypothetical protein Y695_04023 [Hydrogenophaga sp. T4]
MAAEIQRVTISTAPAVSAPSISVRRLSVDAPIFQWMASSSLSTRGSSPLTQSTMASQASQEMVRSSKRTQGVLPNATCNTLTPTRMTTSETSTGIATLNTASGTTVNNSERAMYPSTSSSSGNIAPSNSLRPNSTDDFSSRIPRARRKPDASPQASNTQNASAANSNHTVVWVKPASQACRSSMGGGEAGGETVEVMQCH